MSATPGPTTRADRARAFLRTGRFAMATEVAELPYGFSVTEPQLPDWHDCNSMYVTHDVDGLDAATLLADSDRLQAALPERQIRVEVPAVAARVHAALVGAGWADRSGIYMGFEGSRPAGDDPRVERVDHAVVRPLREEWLRAELPRETTVQHGLIADERLFAEYPLQAFCARDADGVPAAMTLLLGDGATQMVEDVYTTPGARGAGLAAALVSCAVRTALDAGADLVFLPTETDGRARVLYERLGFTVLAEDVSFVRES